MQEPAKEIDNPLEVLDLVNTNDEVVGTISRHEVLSLEKNKMGHVRASLVFLQNKQGKIWIPTRVKEKKIAPLGFDASAGEHLESGEDYISAAKRGLLEELNITADLSDISYVGSVPPHEGMPYFHQVFILPYEDNPHYNQKDYVSFDWFYPDELKAKLEEGAKAKEILLPAVNLLLGRQA